MAHDPEDSVYICMRVEDLEPQVPSVVRKCGRCNEDIWVSQAAIEFATKVKLLICNDCLLNDMVISDPVSFHLHESTREELKSLGYTDEAIEEKLREMLKLTKASQFSFYTKQDITPE